MLGMWQNLRRSQTLNEKIFSTSVIIKPNYADEWRLIFFQYLRNIFVSDINKRTISETTNIIWQNFEPEKHQQIAVNYVFKAGLKGTSVCCSLGCSHSELKARERHWLESKEKCWVSLNPQWRFLHWNAQAQLANPVLILFALSHSDINYKWIFKTSCNCKHFFLFLTFNCNF